MQPLLSKQNLERARNCPNLLVILTNISTAFTLAPELDDDVTNLLELPYDIPQDDAAFLETATLYYNKIIEAVYSGRSIILMHSIPLVLEFLKTLREKKDTPNAAGWVVVSFFHEDEDLLNADINIKPDYRLNIKFHDLLPLLDYPFIKKINIPYRYELTINYLNKLIITHRLNDLLGEEIADPDHSP